MTRFISHSYNDTIDFAEKYAQNLRGGEILAFYGPLGAGKTAFAAGVVKGLENLSNVSSPTFAIINDYGGNPRIYHFDMYRIETFDDLYSTGFFDYLEENAVTLIEWSENIEKFLSEEYNMIKIKISYGENENERIIEISDENISI
ncbi:MAG: tRNA (adenosine(37)-N6)-threonylcarbamoyltransferase complex ATPase subunit type 1 TsaE [Oscillospiraceae bacterium]|nr:tRNA (adenosine(37)-N6)-threonylcarbamoyltransferase complex ATPase subunit type 1 TsaE [Oscillospiraceae bacterium]